MSHIALKNSGIVTDLCIVVQIRIKLLFVICTLIYTSNLDVFEILYSSTKVNLAFLNVVIFAYGFIRIYCNHYKIVF